MGKFVELSNLKRLVKQMRHHNVPPGDLHAHHHFNSLRGGLAEEVTDSLRQINETLQCMTQNDLTELHGGMTWWARDHVDIEAIHKGDPHALEQAAIYVLMEELNGVYYRFDDLLVSLERQLEESEVLAIYPELRSLIDDEGLLTLTPEMQLSDQAILYKSHYLHYHQFFRRGFGGNVNFNFLSRFVSFWRDHPKHRVKVAIDHRRILPDTFFQHFIEKSGWPDPKPLSREGLDAPRHVGLFKMTPIPDESMVSPVAKTEILWALREEVPAQNSRKVVEIEEVVPASEFADHPVVLNRYVHAERDFHRKVFDHFDGAVRWYEKSRYDERLKTDIAAAKIVSHRLKLFRIDGDITEEEWAILTTHFFRQNNLVLAYLSRLNPYS